MIKNYFLVYLFVSFLLCFNSLAMTDLTEMEKVLDKGGLPGLIKNFDIVVEDENGNITTNYRRNANEISYQGNTKKPKNILSIQNHDHKKPIDGPLVIPRSLFGYIDGLHYIEKINTLTEKELEKFKPTLGVDTVKSNGLDMLCFCFKLLDIQIPDFNYTIPMVLSFSEIQKIANKYLEEKNADYGVVRYWQQPRTNAKRIPNKPPFEFIKQRIDKKIPLIVYWNESRKAILGYRVGNDGKKMSIFVFEPQHSEYQLVSWEYFVGLNSGMAASNSQNELEILTFLTAEERKEARVREQQQEAKGTEKRKRDDDAEKTASDRQKGDGSSNKKQRN
jgi:hypothetical protein